MNNKSDSRFKYFNISRLGSSSWSFNDTARRSAVRRRLLARSIAAEPGEAPGTIKARGSLIFDLRESISDSKLVTILDVTGAKCFSSLSRSDGWVASSEPTVKSSRWIRSKVSLTYWSLQLARASPMAEMALSNDPYASVRESAFDNLCPNRREVSPVSPFFV